MTLYLFRSNLGLIRSIGAHDQIPNIEKNTIQNETKPSVHDLLEICRMSLQSDHDHQQAAALISQLQ